MTLELTWAGVTMTDETLEILYNRLLITSVQADVETAKPTMIFVARHGERVEHARSGKRDWTHKYHTKVGQYYGRDRAISTY